MELNIVLAELSVERLCPAGFAHSMWVHAWYVFNDFHQVYEELGAALHLLDLEGEGLFDTRQHGCGRRLQGYLL